MNLSENVALGEALNASVITVEAEEQADVDADYERRVAEAEEKVAGAQAKIEKQEEHLAGAKDALAVAKEELKELLKRETSDGMG